jgi:adenosylcobyric acid synthase
VTGRALLVCGTSSHAGKSAVVAGLCRAFRRRGVRVAPFKGQNMALNAAVTAQGAEIGRAQAFQAVAAGVEPTAAMNPVLLKPTGERSSEVLVRGESLGTLDALSYQEAKTALVEVVDASLRELRAEFELVVCEGAGSPAEINLLRADLVNLGMARRAGIRAVIVGDIDRGGVFAHLYGTVAMLPDELRAAVGGFIINKFRGDPALLADAPRVLEERAGVPVLGVLPWLGDLVVDAEDSLALADLGAPRAAGEGDRLDVAVVQFPTISNFTDLDPLVLEPGVQLRMVRSTRSLGDPDLVVLPGSKRTVADLAWLRGSGLAAAIELIVSRPGGATLLGICGGYQMLGRAILDPDGIESASAETTGLGLLDLTTRFSTPKCTARRTGSIPGTAVAVSGYEIHYGRPTPCTTPTWFDLDGEGEGGVDEAAGIFGTSLHGLFESDGLRRWFLNRVARRRRVDWTPGAEGFAALRDAQADLLADACERHLDLEALWGLSGGQA